MESLEVKSKKSFTVLAVVVACFAVLWPKIFYPMIQSVLGPTSDELEGSLESLNLQKGIHSQMQEAMGEERPLDKMSKNGNRAWVHPSVRQTVRPHSKNAGAVNILVPAYTIGIILFFAYTALRMMMSNNASKKKDLTEVLESNDEVINCVNDDDKKESEKDTLQEMKAKRALHQYGKKKVITALKTIILEMEDMKENFLEFDDSIPKINLKSDVSG